MKFKVNILALCLAVVTVVGMPMEVMAASEAEKTLISADLITMQYDKSVENGDVVYVETYDFGNGLIGDIYKSANIIETRASGTANGYTEIRLKYNGTYFGTLTQKVSFKYDGVNVPTYISSSNEWYSPDPDKNYLVLDSAWTKADGTALIYVMRADVYYNNSKIGKTDFSTTCDKNGNLSYNDVDV